MRTITNVEQVKIMGCPTNLCVVKCGGVKVGLVKPVGGGHFKITDGKFKVNELPRIRRLGTRIQTIGAQFDKR